MDAGKQILHEDKRKERSKSVNIKFIDELFQHFNILDEEGKIKHLGIIYDKTPHQKDHCTCESFYFGNSDEFKKAHPEAFQCKHLIAARELRFEGHP